MVDTSSRQSFEACHVSDVEDLTRPQLRPSIFPNVPPFINFLNPQQKYENFVRLEIPWNLWTACHNPLLIRCMVRAGFKAKQVIVTASLTLSTLNIIDVVDFRGVLQKHDWIYMGCNR